MTETTTPVEEQTSSSVQPGDLTAKLQACREQAGLDIEQAADEMHLSVSLLRALEKEDFAHLPEPPYVRGYLRGYAKLADQDAKQLIRIYETLRGADPDEIAHHFAPARPLGKVTQPTLSASTVKFIGLAVVILGLGLLSMIPGVRGWFSNTWSNFSAQTAPPQVVRPAPALETFTAQKDAEEAAKQQAESTGSDATETPAESTEAETVTTDAPPATDTESQATAEPAAPTTTGESAPTPPVASSAADQVAPDTDTQIVAVAPTTTEKTPTPTPLPDGSESAGAETPTPATGTGTETPATTGTEGTTPATSPQPIAGEVNVKLEFTEEVWMQVKDEGKKTLFESLNSAGSTKEFKATTPLNFKVGNASGVKIYLNGQPFDQAPHTKGSVARFKVE